MFTDISSEMVSAVLPLYVLYGLQATPLQLGLIDGIYQGCSGLVRLAAAVAADHWRRQKDVAAVGYALSTVSRFGLLAVNGALGGIAACVLVDRVGKGIRTAPRDALISLSVPRDRLGLAFGVHRALDTAGAFLGPLIAFGLLALAHRSFDAVFLASASFGLIGLGIIALFVENRRVNAHAPAVAFGIADCFRLFGSRRFRALAIAAGAVTLFTVSDAFIYVGLQRRGSLGLEVFPLLYVGTSLFYLLLAVPAGRLADRFGHRTVFAVGQLLMLAVYALLLVQDLAVASVLVLPLLGAHYACTDGVLMALASGVVQERLRTSGLALLATITSVAALTSSVVVGVLWTWLGMEMTFALALVGLVLALGVAARSLRELHC